MIDLITTGVLSFVQLFGAGEWVADNPIIAAILAALLALFFFFYLLLRRTVMGFKEGIQQGGSNRK